MAETSSAIWSYNINWLAAIFGSRPCSRPCCEAHGVERQKKPASGAPFQASTAGVRIPAHNLSGDYVAVNRKAREAALRESYFAAWRLRLKARDWV
jgi:hypothetical protein